MTTWDELEPHAAAWMIYLKSGKVTGGDRVIVMYLANLGMIWSLQEAFEVQNKKKMECDTVMWGHRIWIWPRVTATDSV